MTHSKSCSCQPGQVWLILSCNLHHSPIRYHRGTFTLVFMIIGSSVYHPEWSAPSVQGQCVLGYLSITAARGRHSTFWPCRAGIRTQFLLLQGVCSLRSSLKRQHRQSIRHHLLSLSTLWTGWELIRSHWENQELICSCIHPSVHSLVLLILSPVLVESLIGTALIGLVPRKRVWAGVEGSCVMPHMSLWRACCVHQVVPSFILPLPQRHNRNQGRGGDGTKGKCNNATCVPCITLSGPGFLFCFIFNQIHVHF